MGVSSFVALGALLATVYLWQRKSKKSLGALPPGPKPVPLLGNILDLTAKELWLPAMKWAKEFGSVTYLHVLGQGLVFLNSSEAAFDLLERKGSTYSDKPYLVMVCELCGCENMVAFTPYGDQSRRQRKLLHRAFGTQVIPQYFPLIESSTKAFLQRLLVDSSEWVKHTKLYAGSLTLSTVYGYELRSSDDKFLKLADECVDILSNRIASGGGIWPVDIFPSLKKLPLWAPGSGFLHSAQKWKRKMEEFVDEPYKFVKTSLKSGTAKPSFCSTLLLDDEKKSETFEFDLKWTANSMYSASIDTTLTAVSHFLLAIMQYPAELAKAQKEIDSVVGSDRLPTFADRPFLPYVEAMYKETLRWAAPVPLSLPHRLMEDDVYNGMFIPKGSLIFGNIWAIVRDEKLYPNAHAFVPERFLEETDDVTKKKMDPKSYVFGFGRRRCPGANLTDSSLWYLMVCMMATLDISKATDDFGNLIEPKIDFNNSVFRIPDPFQVDIRPRSEQALKAISH
ncbi:cytochrome P450 [Pleurotus eryngii]|uniref:Cytochrome P450 n=1 Tax=Pleurotus eryngii TaxID=5323 RepID=A0A9P6DGR2_PLEER|nr:cytochrome P450 [Pleurotus eryngii]